MSDPLFDLRLFKNNQNVRNKIYQGNKENDSLSVCECCWGCVKHGFHNKKQGPLKSIQDFRYARAKGGIHKLTRPQDPDIRDRLCILDNDASIAKILIQYKLPISELYELNSSVETIFTFATIDTFGLNTIETFVSDFDIQKCWKIGILAVDYKGLLVSYEIMVDTLLHEIAHCYHENHSKQFYSKWNELRALYQLYNKKETSSRPWNKLGRENKTDINNIQEDNKILWKFWKPSKVITIGVITNFTFFIICGLVNNRISFKN